MSLTKYITHYVTPPPTLTEEGVKELLSEALKKVQIYRIPKDNTIYVTEVVQPCIRLAYFNRLYPRPPSLPTALGEYLHGLLEESFKSLGYRTEVGVGLSIDDFKLTGRIDALLEDEDGNVKDVLEIKTVGKLPSEPHKPHVLQLQVYIQLLEAQEGTLLYVDRNRGRVKLFTVKPNPQVLKLVVENARVLWEALNNHTPPPAHPGAWCALCPHRRRCRTSNRGPRRVMA